MSLLREAQVYHNPLDPEFGSFILSTFAPVDEKHAKHLASQCIEISKAAGIEEPGSIDDHIERMLKASKNEGIYANARAIRRNPDKSVTTDMFGIGYLSLNRGVALIHEIDVLPAWGKEQINMQRRGIGSAIVHYMTGGLEPDAQIAAAVFNGLTPALDPTLSRKGFVRDKTGSLNLPNRTIYIGGSAHKLRSEQESDRPWLAGASRLQPTS